MTYLWPIHLIYGAGLFVIGSVVGSFLNVCIHRIPWEKSVIWPGSHCPRCWSPIASRDNVPILGWLGLRGACRNCREPISIRYPLVELLVALLFLGVYLVDGVFTPEYVRDDQALLARVLFHLSLVSFLVVISLIDADLTIVPASVTNLGIAAGLLIGTIFPDVRPAPSAAASHLGGFGSGLAGLIVGGSMIGFVRIVGGFVFRREAMGAGDIHILGLIGVYLGWQAVVVVFFLAPFLGLGHALVKYARYLAKRIGGRPVTGADRELPYGPYLSMAALVLLYSWPWAWPNLLKSYFEMFSVLFLFLIGLDR